MATFFTSNQKTPYVKVQTLDGKVILGTNEALDQTSDFLNLINFNDLKVEVISDFATIELTIDILPGAWQNKNFDDVVQPIVEEPYRTKNMGAGEGEELRGLWVVQFGWRDHESNRDVLSAEMLCYTQANQVAVLPEAFGALRVQKTLLMMPHAYLTQTMISQLQLTREYISLQTDQATNNTPANITPQQVYKHIVDDLVAIHGIDAPGLPKLENFVAAGENYLNLTARDAYQEWIEGPLRELSGLLQITQPDVAATMHIRRWLSDWLGQNQMRMYPNPLRLMNGGTGYILIYADRESDVESTETYQKTLDGNIVDESEYRFVWGPPLDIFDYNGIVENATFTYDTGFYTAPAIESFIETVYGTKPEPTDPPQLAETGTEDDSEPKPPSDPRSLYMDVIKQPNKLCSLTIMGQPKLSVTDLVRVNTNNELYNGVYAVRAIIHQIDKNGFMTSFDGYRFTEKDKSSVPGAESGEPE